MRRPQTSSEFVSARNRTLATCRKAAEISAEFHWRNCQNMSNINNLSRGGEGGIRTHGTLSRTHAFQACALSHSATSPAAVLWRDTRGFSRLKWSARLASRSRCARGIRRNRGNRARLAWRRLMQRRMKYGLAARPAVVCVTAGAPTYSAIVQRRCPAHIAGPIVKSRSGQASFAQGKRKAIVRHHGPQRPPAILWEGMKWHSLVDKP